MKQIYLINKILRATIIGSVMLTLTACQNMNNQDVGTVTGAVAGGLLGSTIGNGSGRLVATGIGTLAGAYFGGAIGRNMDETDRLKTQAAMENSQTNHTSTWRNPDTGTRYTVTPKKTYQRPNKQYCREYVMTSEIAGKQEKIYGTACRQPDGTWKVKG